MDIRRRRIAGGLDVTMNPSSMVKPQLWDVWVEDSGEEKWPSMLVSSSRIPRFYYPIFSLPSMIYLSGANLRDLLGFVHWNVYPKTDTSPTEP